MKKALKPVGTSHKIILILLTALLCATMFSFVSSTVLAQEPIEVEPEHLVGIQILESKEWAIQDSIRAVKESNLGNMVILHPIDMDWNFTRIEDAIRFADNLGLFIIIEPNFFLDIDVNASLYPEQSFKYSNHEIIITPDQFSTWQTDYPHLLGILVKEITGKQADLKAWLNSTTDEIDTRVKAEQAIINNITSTLQLADFEEIGAKIFLQENVISYVSANTSHCDVLVSKVFNAPNTELMIGSARGMTNSYNIPAWGLWVDTWKGMNLPPAFNASDVEAALYEGWFYGAKYFFFEQGNFFGTLDRDWPEENKYIILDEDGDLTEYGKVIQEFYTFLQNQQTLDYEQPDYQSRIAVMIGQSGWSSRGQDWGLWDQDGLQADLDYSLLNLFFPGIGDNWDIGKASIGKEFTGLPFGMVDIISIYASASEMEQYDVIIGLGWSQLSDSIANNIENYVEEGGVFLSLLTFTHSNEDIDNLEEPEAWTEGFSSLFGIQVVSSPDPNWNIKTDDFLHNVTFIQDTFWYTWSGKTYSYPDKGEEDLWSLKFNYVLSDSENTSVLAWVDGIQNERNAFIIENKKGAGYTYIVNTRNPNSLPDKVFTDVLTDFIYYLCAYYARPMVYAPYPDTEYWLSQGQADRTVYLMHDNSTETKSFTYYVKSWDADLTADTDYVVFDYINKEFHGNATGAFIPLDVTLQSKEAKLFVLIEDDGMPQVLSSDSILIDVPSFYYPQLMVSLSGVEQTQNVTTIYCAELETPQYVLGTPFNLIQDYNSENKTLFIASDSNFVVGWDNATDIYVAESTISLTEVIWNSSLETLSVSASGIVGQEATIQVHTKGKTPYYLKVNGKESSAWSYDESTGLFSTSFLLTSDSVELVFGFSPIWIDRFAVSDERADVGSVQSVGFHVVSMPNDSDLAGATVSVNGTEYVTNQTGWISFETSHKKVGRVAWNVTGMEYEGLTVYTSSAGVPSITWDMVKVTDSVVFDNVVQVGSLQTLWLNAEYAYDSTVFDNSKGTIYLNGEPMVWSSQNSRWEYNVTSTAVGLQEYASTSVDDEIIGLTAIDSQDLSMDITWDKIEITQTEFETNTLGGTNAKVTVAYDYTKNPVTGATVSINGILCNEIEQGTYVCIIDGWSPLQSFDVKAESVGFEQNRTTVLSVHLMNTVFFVAIGLALVIAVVCFVVRKKRNRQHEIGASGRQVNIRLLNLMEMNG